MGQAKLKKRNADNLIRAIKNDDAAAFGAALNIFEQLNNTPPGSFFVEDEGALMTYMFVVSAYKCFPILFGRIFKYDKLIPTNEGLSIYRNLMLHYADLLSSETENKHLYLRNCLSKVSNDDFEKLKELDELFDVAQREAYNEEAAYRYNLNTKDELDGHIRHVEDGEIKPKKSKIF